MTLGRPRRTLCSKSTRLSSGLGFAGAALFALVEALLALLILLACCRSARPCKCPVLSSRVRQYFVKLVRVLRVDNTCRNTHSNSVVSLNLHFD